MTVSGLAHGLAVGLAVTALTLSGATAATANEPSAVPGGGQLAKDRGADTGRAVVVEALERDLGLSPAEAGQLFDSQPAAVELDEKLAGQLGSSFGGSWFDQETGTLTVAVTDSGAARQARAAGAEAKLVTRSEQELDAVKDELDALVEQDPGALAGATSWGIDAQANQVVLTVLEGQAEGVAELVDQYGEAIRVEESVAAPSLANHPFIDGGMPYFAGGGRCSVGFNVRNPSTGVGFFLTAGHCHGTGAITSSHGIDIGPVVASFFPGFDDALVRNDNPGQWLQGPWISTHPGFITVGGMADPPVGTAICKSGSTTQVTCGEVTVTDETVQLVDGSIINNLTRHDACVERGDSGGSNYTAAGTLAAGVTSAAALTAADRCLETIGEQNVSWYYPLTLSLPFYESTHGVELLTG